MATIIVERSFDPPLSQADLDAVAERMGPCLEVYNVKWIRSYWSDDRSKMVCEYQAADAESVRNVQREAEAKFDRVWVADVLTG
jgi:hypothetical protein